MELAVTEDFTSLTELLKSTKCILCSVTDFGFNQYQTLARLSNEKTVYENILETIKELLLDNIDTMVFHIHHGNYIISIHFKNGNQLEMNHQVFGYNYDIINKFFNEDEFMNTKFNKPNNELYIYKH